MVVRPHCTCNRWGNGGMLVFLLFGKGLLYLKQSGDGGMLVFFLLFF